MKYKVTAYFAIVMLVVEYIAGIFPEEERSFITIVGAILTGPILWFKYFEYSKQQIAEYVKNIEQKRLAGLPPASNIEK